MFERTQTQWYGSLNGKTRKIKKNLNKSVIIWYSGDLYWFLSGFPMILTDFLCYSDPDQWGHNDADPIRSGSISLLLLLLLLYLHNLYFWFFLTILFMLEKIRFCFVCSYAVSICMQKAFNDRQSNAWSYVILFCSAFMYSTLYKDQTMYFILLFFR